MSLPPKNHTLFGEAGRICSPGPFYFESSVRESGYRLIAGIDEAGRGPLAGPVVAAAVILPEGEMLPGVTDSKQMSAAARKDAFEIITERAVSLAVGVVSHRFIDKNNILRATLEAMRRATAALDPGPDFLLVDGINKVPVPIRQLCIKKGDRRSMSISAASVIAKVYRDRIMEAYHRQFPDYGFDAHKGYGTALHMKALRRLGPCIVHRTSFKGVVKQ
ncbi:MAG: ribonuclease HII [Desulfatiglandaceae bacterium]